MTSAERCDGKSVLVIGGTGGIGLAMARGLATAGAVVAVVGRHAPEPNAGPLSWIDADLRDASAAQQRLQQHIGAIGGKLDVLIYSAVSYGAPRRRFLDTVEDEWADAFAVNVVGMRVALRAVLPAMMRASSGLIVGLTSEVAFHGGPQRLPYASSKAAAHGLLAGLSQELDGTGVRVVMLLPSGMVDTPGIRRRRSDGFDFSSYARSESFAGVAVSLVANMGEGHDGGCLVIDSDGTARPWTTGAAPSQSRR